MKIKLLELKQIIREAMLQENHPTPDSMLIFAQDILGYAYDGEGVEEDPELDYAKNEELEDDDDSFPVSAHGLGGPVGKRRF